MSDRIFNFRRFFILIWILYFFQIFKIDFAVVTTDNQGNVGPCVFPFKYQDKYYYECVTFENRSPWCATTFDYDQDKRWGYCTDIKCFRLVDEKKIFSEGRKVCMKDQASLVSVHNIIEQCKKNKKII
jgi:hypothetical protein